MIAAARRSRSGSSGSGRPRIRGQNILRDRAFRLIWFGETSSALGTSISRLALPLIAVVTVQASTFEVGLLAAAAWLPWLVIGLPAGAWVDRLPLRPVMLLCNGVSLLALLSVPVIAWAGAVRVWQLLAVALLTGTAAVFFQTAMQVYLPTVVRESELGAANATLQGSESVAQVTGPGAAGLIAQAVGAVAGLIVDALSFLISSVCLLLVRVDGSRREQPVRTTTLRREMADGIGFVMSDPYLRVMTACGAASNLALTGYQSILAVFLIREVGVSPGGVGLLISGMSVGGALGAAASGPLGRRLGTARATLVGQLGAAPFSLLIPLARPGLGLALVVIGGIGVGAGVVSSNVIRSSFRQTYTPRRLLGRVVVTMGVINYGAIPLGALLAGVLGALLGLRGTMWLMAVGLVLASLILLAGPIRRHRDLPADRAPPLTSWSPAGTG